MPIDMLAHVDPIIGDVDPVQPAGRDQTLQDTDVLYSTLFQQKSLAFTATTGVEFPVVAIKNKEL